MQPTAPERHATPASPDHDLPIIALERDDLPRRPDWPSLLRDGVQPGLMLGAERRSNGRR